MVFYSSQNPLSYMNDLPENQEENQEGKNREETAQEGTENSVEKQQAVRDLKKLERGPGLGEKISAGVKNSFSAFKSKLSFGNSVDEEDLQKIQKNISRLKQETEKLEGEYEDETESVSHLSGEIQELKTSKEKIREDIETLEEKHRKLEQEIGKKPVKKNSRN